MNESQTDAQTTSAVVVSEDARMMFLPKHFGSLMMSAESLVYSWAKALGNYSGGYWEFCELSNGGCFLYPSHQMTFTVSVQSNYYEGVVSPVAFGIIVTLFALSSLMCAQEGTDAGEKLINQYWALREYAHSLAEAGEIMRAID